MTDMTEQTEAAEVEALSEALSSPGFVNAITDAVDGAFRNPPPPSTLHDDAHPIAIADAAVGAARDYLLASDWLAADRAAAEARGAERVLAAVEALVSSWEAGNESYGAGDREWNRTAALRALVDDARAAATGGGS